jgi:isochorismate synthase EntC
VLFRGDLDPLLLLAALQERDPRAYQFCLQLPDGAAFLGSSPEQLYSRTGRRVASEAVAATRARGPPGAPDLAMRSTAACHPTLAPGTVVLF